MQGFKRRTGPVVAVLALTLLSACAGRVDGRAQCNSLVDSGWKELDLAKAEGFDGTVSYAKAVSLLTAAKGQQVIDRFPSCIDKAKRAHVYIRESRAGR